MTTSRASSSATTFDLAQGSPGGPGPDARLRPGRCESRQRPRSDRVPPRRAACRQQPAPGCGGGFRRINLGAGLPVERVCLAAALAELAARELGAAGHRVVLARALAGLRVARAGAMLLLGGSGA